MFDMDDPKNIEMLKVLLQRGKKTWPELWGIFTSGIKEDDEILRKYGFDPNTCTGFLVHNMYFTAAYFIIAIAHITGKSLDEALETIKQQGLQIEKGLSV